jgi:Amt family ammonium transporter
MFAIITPALISGAIVERVPFRSYCLFLVLWLIFVYCPMAHMVWGKGGFLGLNGGINILDFALVSLFIRAGKKGYEKV